MRVEIGEALQNGIVVAKPDILCHDDGKGGFAGLIGGDRPGVEPGVDGPFGAGEDLVGDNVAEDRKLEAPSADMGIAGFGFREFMHQMQPGGGAFGFKANRDTRGAGGHRLAAGVAEGENNPFGRFHLDDFA
jgi:hypothetical protein